MARFGFGSGGAVLALWLLVLSCSSPDHPKAIDPDEHSTPRGGRSGNGGAGNSAGRGSLEGGTAPASHGGAQGDGGESPGFQGDPLVFAFDPGNAYIHGSLEEGTDDYAVSSVLNPNRYTTDIPTAVSNLKIFRGSLYYLDFGVALRIFNPDYVGSAEWGFDYDGPANPEANDEIVPTPACGDDGLVTEYLVSPDGKHLVYQCNYEAWYEDDALVYDGPEPLLALGYDGLFLIGSVTGLGAMSIWDAQRHTQERSHSHAIAWRAIKDGFRYVTVTTDTEPEPGLWELDAEANATQVGIYPPPPEGIDVNGINEQVVLLPDGTLFQTGTTRDRIYDVIIRRKLDAEESELVYTEADNPRVKLHHDHLFTGP